ncbi:MAG: hypothetical protein HQM14_00085 [SAR324 cluster bacterium]|nr:hypothetical protein [SAR324 cluster bacterium]
MAEDKKKKIIRELPEIEDPKKIFTLLEEDLQAFLELAKHYKQESPAARIMRIAKNSIKKSSVSAKDDICGTLIGASFPTVKIKESVKALEKNPLNSESRLALIEPFAMKGIKGDLLIYRQILLHSMLELSAYHISSAKINMAIMIQRRYLDKIADFFKEEATNCQAILNDLKAREARKKQEPIKEKESSGRTHTKEELIEEIELCKKKHDYVKEVAEILKGRTLTSDVEVDMADLRSSGPIPKDVLYKVIVPLLGGMVCLPVVQKNTQVLIDTAKGGAPTMPIGGFYESRMHRLESKVLFAAYLVGWQDVAQACQKAIMGTFNSINVVIPMVGSMPSSKFDKVCVREYGMICLLVFQQLPLLGAVPPGKHKQSMQRAVDLLQTISDEMGVIEILNALNKSMSSMR